MSEPVPKAPAGPWFNEIAAFLGEAYWAPETTRVQAFTTGTEQEVDFLCGALALEPGQRVLDAGCGPGRHSLSLARRGHRRGRRRSLASLRRARVRARPSRSVSRITLVSTSATCAGSRSQRSSTPSCACARAGSACSVAATTRGSRSSGSRRRCGRVAAWRSRRSTPTSQCGTPKRVTPSTPPVGSTTSARRCGTPAGPSANFDLWTTCFTPRELMLLAEAAGLRVDAVHGVTPGKYAAVAPAIDLPEFLLLARRS